MAGNAQQNFGNHSRYVPLYHFVLAGMLAVNFFHSVRVLAAHVSGGTAYNALQAGALLLLAWYARAFALRAQDRVIRLEMRLRMQALTPDLMASFERFTPGQITALRFAGDAELGELARAVLAGKLTKSAEIKRAVKDWQADHWRV